MELELKLKKGTEEKSLADKLAQLTVRIQGGDSEAFSEFFEVSKNYVAAVIRGFDSERASGQLEDIMQDVYIKAFNSIGSVKDPQSTMKWLRTIASSTTKDFFKKKAVKHEDVVKMAPDDENPEDTLESLNAPFLIPEDFVENIAMQEVLSAGIKKLPEKQAYMIFEFYINGGSISDIADELDMTEGAVKTNLSRARKSLQAIFTEMEEKDGIKLRSVGIIPLFLFIFYLLMRANPVSAATSDAVWDGISNSAAGSGGTEKTSLNNNSGEDAAADGTDTARETHTGEAADGTDTVSKAQTGEAADNTDAVSNAHTGETADGTKAADTGAETAGTAAKAASGAAKTAGISAAAKGIIIGAVALVVIAAIAIMAWNTLKTGSTEETAEETTEVVEETTEEMTEETTEEPTEETTEEPTTEEETTEEETEAEEYIPDANEWGESLYSALLEDDYAAVMSLLEDPDNVAEMAAGLEYTDWFYWNWIWEDDEGEEFGYQLAYRFRASDGTVVGIIADIFTDSWSLSAFVAYSDTVYYGFEYTASGDHEVDMSSSGGYGYLAGNTYYSVDEYGSVTTFEMEEGTILGVWHV